MTPSSPSTVRTRPKRPKRNGSAGGAGQATSRSTAALLDRPIGGLQATFVFEKEAVAATAETWRVEPGGNRSLLFRTTKRLIDVVGALAILTILSPLLAVVTVILAATTGGHPFFVQDRIGYLGRRFRLYKFRSMVIDAEQLRHTVENQQEGPVFKNNEDPRVTPFGKLLRRTSIDELPQLFNVLTGAMSLIGPRPCLPHEVAAYEPWQRKRLSVKPGLSCLWQVSGRSEIAFYRWMLMDLWYVRNQSLRTDAMLLWRTPWAVLSRRGAY